MVRSSEGEKRSNYGVVVRLFDARRGEAGRRDTRGTSWRVH
jgi:hypothetical protein